MNSVVKGCISGVVAFGVAWGSQHLLTRPGAEERAVEPLQTVPATDRGVSASRPEIRPEPGGASQAGEAARPAAPRPPAPRPPIATPTAVASADSPHPEDVTVCEDEWSEIEASDRKLVAGPTPPPAAPLDPARMTQTPPTASRPIAVAMPDPQPLQAAGNPAARSDSSAGPVDASKAEQVLARFAAAQESLRNFRLQMPDQQAPASVRLGNPPTADATNGANRDLPTSTPASQRPGTPQLPKPHAVATASPVVINDNKAEARQADEAALQNLNRASEAMQRLSRKLVGGRRP